MAEVCRHVVISGLVQGVGYRAWTADEAARLGLLGWVRNRRDGGVEAVFSGDERQVGAMIAACRQGPSFAKVANVVPSEADENMLALRGGEAFAMLPTV